MSNEREKLIDEAIAHFDYGVTHDIFSEPVTTYAKLARAALAYIRHVPDTDFGKWIPVSERLPEENTSVIAATDNRIVFQCLYAYDGWDLWEGNEVTITHWMPLPEPPEVGK